jgi:hypothetical protein
MRQAELDSSTQLVLIGLLLVVWVAFFTRTVLFVRLEIAGIGPLYPESWSPAERTALEKFRLLVGLILFPLCVAYVLATSSNRTDTTFEYLELLSLILMISLCYAWTLLLAPRDLRMLILFPRSFLLMFVFLTLWWGTSFSALGWMLTKVLTPLPVISPPNRAYAHCVDFSSAQPKCGCCVSNGSNFQRLFASVSLTVPS